MISGHMISHDFSLLGGGFIFVGLRYSRRLNNNNNNHNSNTKDTFWLIWFINQRALYNHALSVVIGVVVIGIIIIGIIVIGAVCAHLPLAQG